MHKSMSFPQHGTIKISSRPCPRPWCAVKEHCTVEFQPLPTGQYHEDVLEAVRVLIEGAVVAGAALDHAAFHMAVEEVLDLARKED